MEDRSDPALPERIPVEQIRAELRAAGLLKHLDAATGQPAAERRPREAKILPFRRIEEKKPVVRKANWKRQAALIVYALLGVAAAVLMLR